MDSTFFEWNASLAKSEDDVDELSLQDLLNCIPTDMPPNASEFDAELRNLIIQLYSDKEATHREKPQCGRCTVTKDRTSSDFIIGKSEQDVVSLGRTPLSESTKEKYTELASNQGISNEIMKHTDTFDDNDLSRSLALNTISEESISDVLCSKNSASLSSYNTNNTATHKCSDDMTKTVNGNYSHQPLPQEMGKFSLPSMKAEDFTDFDRDLDCSNLDDSNNLFLERSTCADSGLGLSVTTSQGIFDEGDVTEESSHFEEEERRPWDQEVEQHLQQQDPKDLVSKTIPGTAIKLPNECRSIHAMSFDSETLASSEQLGGEDSHNFVAVSFSSDGYEAVKHPKWNLDQIATQAASYDSGKSVLVKLTNGDYKSANTMPYDSFISMKHTDKNLDKLSSQMKEFSSLENHSGIGVAHLFSINSQLESRLDSLTVEYSNLINERIVMQKKVWELEAALALEKKSNELIRKDNTEVVSRAEEMSERISDLQESLCKIEFEDLQKDRKIQEVITKLRKSENYCKNLSFKVVDTENKLSEKQKALELASSKLDKCLKSINIADDQKQKYESELQSLSESFKKLKQNKNWLEFQLRTLQESREKMELQVEGTKAQANEQESLALDLKAENTRLTSELVDCKHKSYSEKQEVLKDLEKVEEDVLRCMSKCKALMMQNRMLEKSLEEKEITVAVQDRKVKEIIQLMAETEEVAERLRNELEEKDKQISEFVKDKEIFDDTLKHYDNQIQEFKVQVSSLEQRVKEKDVEILEIKDEAAENTKKVEELENEKIELQQTLDIAKEEKKEFENATQALRDDMQKVDRVFHVMKRELAKKSAQLLDISEKKEAVLKEIASLQDYLLEQEATQKQLNMQLQEKQQLLIDLEREKSDLNDVVKNLNLKSNALEVKLERFKEENSRLEKEYQEINRKHMLKENQLNKSRNELCCTQEQLKVQKETSEREITKLEESKAEKEKELDIIRRENQVETTKLRAKETRLALELREKQQSWFERQQEYEKSILSLVGKLKEESTGREMAEREANAVRQSSESEARNRREKISTGMTNLNEQFLELQQERDEIKTNVIRLRTTTVKLLHVLVVAMGKLKRESLHLNEENVTLKANVESLAKKTRDKQRVLQILEEHQKAQTERITMIENELCSKQEELLSMKSQLFEAKENTDLTRKQFCSSQEETRKELMQLRKVKEELENCIALERNKSHGLSLNLQHSNDVILQLKEETEYKMQENDRLKTEVQSLSSSKNELVKESSATQHVIADLKGKLFAVQNQMDIEQGRVRALEDQAKHLKWQIKQLETDKKDLRTELNTSDKRHTTEFHSLKSMLEVSRTELGSLRAELSGSRKAKLDYQNQVMEARESLRRRTIELESLQNEVRRRNQSLIEVKQEMQGSKSVSLRELVEFMVQKAMINVPSCNISDEVTKNQSSGTMDALRKCMLNLRDQMDSLQAQMTAHMQSLQVSEGKWRSFEENVVDLQKSCHELQKQAARQTTPQATREKLLKGT